MPVATAKAKKAKLNTASSMSNSDDEDEGDSMSTLMEAVLEEDSGKSPSGSDNENVNDDDDDDDDDDEALVAMMKQYGADDIAGEKLNNEQLAKLLNKMFSTRLSETTAREKMAAIKRPENCDKLMAPKLNPAIYRKAREFAAKRDSHMFKVQKALIKGVVPVAQITDMVLKQKAIGKEDIAKIKRLGLDALSLLAHVNYELNTQRKYLLKPELGPEYAALCSPEVPATQWLFGDDLSKQVQELGAENRLGRKVGKNQNQGNKTRQNHAYNTYNQNALKWQSKNFRGRGKQHPQRGRGRGADRPREPSQ